MLNKCKVCRKIMSKEYPCVSCKKQSQPTEKSFKELMDQLKKSFVGESENVFI